MHANSSVQTARGTSKLVGLVNACLRGVSVAEAERVLAKIWQRIEEYDAETPELQFDFRDDGHIDIEFSFSNRATAALILGDLSSPCPSSLREDIAQTDHEPSGYRGTANLGAPRSGPGWS